MSPDDNKNNTSRHHLQPIPQSTDRQTIASDQAAAALVRSQLDDIYNGTAAAAQPDPQPQEHVEIPPQATDWQQYHSAWQNYYQQYYERYYLNHIHQVQNAAPALSHQPTSPSSEDNTALASLKSQLRQQLTHHTTRIRSSKHFVPFIAAACVILVFLFLQYNRVIFANVEAYVSPGNIDPANIIVDPTTTTAASPEPKLIIPKINVDVPVVYDVTPDYDAQMKAMNNGIAWFGIPGANSRPGQVGNTVLSGHSSNDVLDSGSYKFIFARLDHLEVGDTIYANYQSTRHTYTVTKKEVVKPTEVDKLIYPTTKPILTLITCTPLGTSLNRLLVTAEQVSPSPSQALAAPETPAAASTSSIPGNSPTFLQRIFGSN